MFGIRHGVQWSLGKFTTIAIGSYGLDVRYTTKPSNGYRGVFSSSIGPYIEGYKNIPYNTSSWFIWQDPAGMLRYQQLTDRPPDPMASGPAGVEDLNHKNLSSVSLAFDQNNNRVVSWSEKNLCFVSYYDENTQLQRASWVGYDSVSFFDGIFLGQEGSDVIIFYLDATRTQVKYRLQRDRFTVEYTHHIFREVFFNVAPTTFNLDHIEITSHTYVLYLTDDAGRELQLESYSYGFNARDSAKNTLSLTGGRYQFLAIADASETPEKTLSHTEFSRGIVRLQTVLLELNEQIDQSFSISYGSATEQVAVTDTQDAAYSTCSLSKGTAYSILERTATTNDSLGHTIRLRGGLSATQKIVPALDATRSSYSVSKGTSRQITFLPDAIYEAATSSVVIAQGDSTYYARTELSSEESTSLELSVDTGLYINRTLFLFGEDSASASYAFYKGSYDIVVKILPQHSDNGTLQVAISKGSLQDSQVAAAEDLIANRWSLSYGAYYETIKKAPTMQDYSVYSVALRRGSSRTLYQASDIVVDAANSSLQLSRGLVSAAPIKIASMQEAMGSAISLSGGLIDFFGSDYTFDPALAWYLMPDMIGVFTQGLTDSTGTPYVQFLGHDVYPLQAAGGTGKRPSVRASDVAKLYYSATDLLWAMSYGVYNASSEDAFVWLQE